MGTVMPEIDCEVGTNFMLVVATENDEQDLTGARGNQMRGETTL